MERLREMGCKMFRTLAELEIKMSKTQNSQKVIEYMHPNDRLGPRILISFKVAHFWTGPAAQERYIMKNH